MRIRSNKRLKTQSFIRKQPFQQSVISVVIILMEKALNQIYKGSFKKAAQQIKDAQANLKLMDNKTMQYLKLKILICNTEAILLRKEGNSKQAQISIDYIQKVDFQCKQPHPAQRAITLLNKCLIFAELKKQQQNTNQKVQIQKRMDQQVQRINVLNQAFQLLTKKSSKQHIQGTHKYNQLLILFFCNLANELAKIANRHEQAKKLYKKAYQYSLRVLGEEHRLSIILLKITQNFKRSSNSRNDPSRNKKSPDFPRSRTLNSEDQSDFLPQLKSSQSKIKNFHLKRTKNLSGNKTRQIEKTYGEENIYSKIYGNDPFRMQKNHRISTQLSPKRNKRGLILQDSQMKQLDRIKKMYAPANEHKKQRKNIRDIILKMKSSFDKDKKNYLFPKNTENLISQIKLEQLQIRNSPQKINFVNQQKIGSQKQGCQLI